LDLAGSDASCLFHLFIAHPSFHLPSHSTSSLTLLWALAEWAGPLGGARTRESIDGVGAGSGVLTRAARALVDVLVAVDSFPAGVAIADVARSRGGGL